jgi:hypothetical protein
MIQFQMLALEIGQNFLAQPEIRKIWGKERENLIEKLPKCPDIENIEFSLFRNCLIFGIIRKIS